jgi:hypothetical protein
VDLASPVFQKSPGHLLRERRASRNAQAHGIPGAREFCKRSKNGRHSRKHGCAAGGQSINERTGHDIRRGNKRDPPAQQWSDQIAEAIRMRKRNGSIIAVILPQSHRVTDIVAISKQLRSGKANRTRLSGRPRSQLEKIAPQTGAWCRRVQRNRFNSSLLDREAKARTAKFLNLLATPMRHVGFQGQKR